jgi:predicted transcriptional regulator
MSDETLKVLDLLIRVLLYATIYFIAFAALLSPLPLWNKYVKTRDKEKKEAERIIVKMNDKKEKNLKEISNQVDRINTLDQQIEIREKKLAELKYELDEPIQEIPEDAEEETQEIDYENLKVIELREIGKKRGIKGATRMKKAQLVKLLSD